MLVCFDEKGFIEDLDTLVRGQKRFKNPLVVLPTDKDVEAAARKYADIGFKITFIDYPYFDSRQWITDADYDHIDIFRLDQVVIKKALGIPVGRATVKRVLKKKKDDKEA